MSVTSPNSIDRDGEALRRAQRAHEPSMEEILASIRAIIADDRQIADRQDDAKATPRSQVVAGPQIVYSADAPKPVAEPEPERDTVAAKAESAPPPEPAPTNVVWARPRIEAIAAPTPTQPPIPEVVEVVDEAPEEPLLSDDADRSVAASFNALSTSLALQSAELVEGMTREMLRPMIKTWLDEHLPAMVERLVRAEIQRVARGGR